MNFYIFSFNKSLFSIFLFLYIKIFYFFLHLLKLHLYLFFIAQVIFLLSGRPLLQYTKVLKDGSTKIEHLTKECIIRHIIHHPENPYNSYTEQEFDDSSQRALAGFIEWMDARGAYIILSNSDPKNVDPEDDFFEDLYADYDIQRIFAKQRVEF